MGGSKEGGVPISGSVFRLFEFYVLQSGWVKRRRVFREEALAGSN